jgi:WD40 repeat protein
MSRVKKRKLVGGGLLALALAVLLLGSPRCRVQRSNDTGDRPAVVLEGHRFPVQALAFGPDGTTLASAAYDINAPESRAEVLVWEVATCTGLARHTEQPKGLSHLAFAPDGQHLAAAQGRSLLLWESADAHDKGRRFEQPADVCAVAFSASGAVLAWGDIGGTVALRDAAGNGSLTFCKRDGDPALALAFAPDGTTLAGGGYDTTVRLWGVATGTELACLRGHASVVHAVAYAPDGRALASGDVAGVVKLWDVTASKERAPLDTAGKDVAAVVFSPDGRTLAVAVDEAVQLWDVARGRCVAGLPGHTGKVKCLAFSPDGTRLASAGHDRTVRLWDMVRDQAENFVPRQ